MNRNAVALMLSVAMGVLGGCVQTSFLRAPSGTDPWAIVDDPLPGKARIAVMLDGKKFLGVEGASHKESGYEQPIRFGWDPAHRHPHIKQEMKFFLGSAMLVASDGSRLLCDHLQHGDEWRLRCKAGDGEILLQRVKQ